MAALRTILRYMEDSHLLERTARVLMVEAKNNKYNVITDETIFYPQGGGQPYDQGEMLQKDTGVHFRVQEVFFDAQSGQVQHIGTFENCSPSPTGTSDNSCPTHTGTLDTSAPSTSPAGSVPVITFAVGSEVVQRVDGARRGINMRNHSAGHLIALASRQIGLPLVERKGYHFTDGPYVEFEGKVAEADTAKAALERQVNLIIADKRRVQAVLMEKDMLGTLCDVVPAQLPENKPVRVVTVEGLKGCPCGGTHVKNTGEVGKIEIRKITCRKNMTKTVPRCNHNNVFVRLLLDKILAGEFLA